MDGLLSRASIAGQHINEYTGTDYTAIDALRKDISKQEEVVKNCATGCNAARAQQQDAHNNQSNASREIVGLLERKSSWSPVDLERYMALVRSDHVNEQAVQAAKDNLKAMEQKLDEARAMLERLERKRYHEEQIWSDTIRRNSTWVTFGLMGVNIILLLAQITIFEPHRRKKIAADVQEMLDKRERNSTAAIDEDALASLVSRVLNKTQPATSPEVRSDIDLVNELLSRDIAPGTSGESSGAAIPPPQPRLMRISAEPWWSAASAADRLRMTRDIISDQFSERLVQLRKMDVTTVACIGAAVGAAISSGLIVGLSRPT
jgi:sensitive to high expression protein 9